MKKVTRDNTVRIARWHARRFFKGHGDCQYMWFYLIIAEALAQGATL